MPLTVARTGKANTGRRSVAYRDAAGNTFDALVIGAGSSSGLKLKLTAQKGPDTVANSVKDNVALATAKTDTNVYFNRLA